MEIAVVGIDLGKNKCSVVGLDAAGKVITRRRMSARACSSSRRACRPASSQWKRAAGPIILDELSSAKVTKFA